MMGLTCHIKRGHPWSCRPRKVSSVWSAAQVPIAAYLLFLMFYFRFVGGGVLVCLIRHDENGTVLPRASLTGV